MKNQMILDNSGAIHTYGTIPFKYGITPFKYIPCGIAAGLSLHEIGNHQTTIGSGIVRGFGLRIDVLSYGPTQGFFALIQTNGKTNLRIWLRNGEKPPIWMVRRAIVWTKTLGVELKLIKNWNNIIDRYFVLLETRDWYV